MSADQPYPPMEHRVSRYDFHDKPADYARLRAELAALLAGEHDLVANAANAAALLFEALPEVNWAGFYFLRDGQLVVGPFQGKPACARIPFGRGVCGTTAVERKTIVVADVHAFPGHIACDSASASEIVIPLIKDGKVVGVFDIDSPVLDRFNEEDRVGLERMVAAFMEATDF
jgi:GAF domain-containing protein